MEEVLVGIDGTDASARAAEWAARRAAGRGAVLCLVHAFRWPVHRQLDPHTAPDVTGREAERRWARDVLVEAAGRCREAGARDVRAEVVDGDPVDVLMSRAEEADLVVVGHSATGAAAKLLLGSTAAALVRSSPRPVVVVRAESVVRAPRSGGAAPVVVGVDGAPSSVRAVRFGYAFAADHGADVLLVHASASAARTANRLLPAGAETATYFAGRAVAREVADCARRHPGVSGRLLVSPGDPVEVLLDAAEDAGLVVVGSHGRGPVRTALLGSVSTSVVDLARSPVAVLSPRAAVDVRSS